MLTKAYVTDALEYAGQTLTVSMRPFCLLVINNLFKKYGEVQFKRVVSSEASGEINDVLTYVVELGALKCIKDNKLIVNNDNELFKRAVGIAYCINIDLGDIFRQLKLISDDTLGYYNTSAIEIVAHRIVNHIKTHLSYDKLPKNIKDDTFTVNEMFNFYLSEYLVR